MADFSLPNGLSKSLDSQLRDLRKQITHISKSLADHGLDFEDIADEANDFVHGAQKKARKLTRQARRDVDVISHAAQKAPAAAGTALVVAAAVGLGLGLLYHLAQRED